MLRLFVLVLALVSLFPTSLWAWGLRGHAAICEASAFLVKDKNLKTFLQSRTPTLGHLCNTPDIYWRSLGPEVNKANGPSHYIDPEILGFKPDQVPLDFKKLATDFNGSENKFKASAKVFSVPEEFGSLWWRADQFYRLIANLDFKQAPPPADRKQEQDDKLAFNTNVYSMLMYMGLMGHFVGDASQPLHNTANYDGYENGHGGLHAYYEYEIVSQFGPELPNEIYKKALNLKNASFLKKATTIEKMKELSVVSHKDLEKLWKLDPVIKKSNILKEKGMNIKTEAERKSAEVGHKIFRTLLIEELARSSALLAHLWEEAYNAAGKPDLSKYRSYKYPFSVDFVKPDYYEEEKPKAKN